MQGYTLITGATSGIGKAFAYEYGKKGCPLIITGQREKLLNANAEDLRKKYGIEVKVIISDLSLDENIHDLEKLIEETNIETLINNAGMAHIGYFQDVDYSFFQNMINLHIICLTRLTKAVLPQMIERNSGTIINVASTAAFSATPKHNVYAGSKAYIMQFTECLHLDLMNTKIKIQVVCPNYTRTDIQDKIGISKKRQQGDIFIRYETPEQVVKHSMDALKKDKVICICGDFISKYYTFTSHFIPRKYYYKFVSKMYDE
ncbi:MAG: SDR family NAD(P)-dependent oxidoreductase [Oscillospiraceae bacterium]|nr:SDR family NAD(P)-dependent oxidoreductase [Oscillospiraceae bacterium]